MCGGRAAVCPVLTFSDRLRGSLVAPEALVAAGHVRPPAPFRGSCASNRRWPSRYGGSSAPFHAAMTGEWPRRNTTSKLASESLICEAVRLAAVGRQPPAALRLQRS